MRLKLLACLFAFLLLTMPTQVLAEGVFSQGKEFFDAGDFTAAVEKFSQVLAEDPGNLDASFYLGRAAFETGDYETAVMAFERILLMDPDARRVKLELARCHLSLGSREIAREYFRSVQATNPPPVVWQQIQQYLDAIDSAGERHLFNGFLTLGLMYDSNVGAVTSHDSVAIGDLEILLDQQVEPDTGLQATLVLNHLYRFSDTPYAWKSTLTSYNNFYEEETDYDLNYFGLHTGLIRQDESSLWELQGFAAQADLASDRYLGLLGGGLNYSRFLSRYVIMNLGLSFQDRSFYQNDGRDSNSWVVSVNPVLNFAQNRISLFATREWEDANSEQYDNLCTTVGLRYDRQFPADFAGYAGFRFLHTDYDGEEPFFLTSRDDRQSIWTVGVSKTLWRSPDRTQSLAAQVSYSYTDNDSNIEIYSYDKNVTLTTVTFSF